MKLNLLPCTFALVAAWMLVSCSTPSAHAPAVEQSGFADARGVIERNCVHCHGTQRLATMPSFNDTRSLAALRGTGKWIVPGKPDESRFLQVVTLSDSQAGAMPPTGHAIAAKDIAKLRAWIVAGAPLPSGAPIVLKPQGEGIRSM